MTFRPTSVFVAKSGDVAYTYGTYDLSMTGPDGRPVTDKGKYVTVYKKQADGSWKAAVDTFNSDLPPSPPPPPPAGKKK
jgi:ketosteroid isomerase-like protein